MEFCKAILENDLNPFALFDSSGKLKDFNKEAEFLFDYVKPKEIFELALLNAPKTYGFNRKFLKLNFGRLNFYAILVGYIDSEYLAIKLYKEVFNEENIKTDKKLEPVNIFNIIDLAKSTAFLQSDIKIDEIYDISIPEIKINVNNFLLVLNEIFALFKDEKELTLKVYVKIGEYEIINNKKHQIIAIDFISNRSLDTDSSLYQKSKHAHINIFKTNQGIRLEFPMIL